MEAISLLLEKGKREKGIGVEGRHEVMEKDFGPRILMKVLRNRIR